MTLFLTQFSVVVKWGKKPALALRKCHWYFGRVQVQCGFKFLKTIVNSVCTDCTFVRRNGTDFEVYKTSLMYTTVHSEQNAKKNFTNIKIYCSQKLLKNSILGLDKKIFLHTMKVAKNISCQKCGKTKFLAHFSRENGFFYVIWLTVLQFSFQKMLIFQILAI